MNLVSPQVYADQLNQSSSFPFDDYDEKSYLRSSTKTDRQLLERYKEDWSQLEDVLIVTQDMLNKSEIQMEKLNCRDGMTFLCKSPKYPPFVMRQYRRQQFFDKYSLQLPANNQASLKQLGLPEFKIVFVVPYLSCFFVRLWRHDTLENLAGEQRRIVEGRRDAFVKELQSNGFRTNAATISDCNVLVDFISEEKCLVELDEIITEKLYLTAKFYNSASGLTNAQQTKSLCENNTVNVQQNSGFESDKFGCSASFDDEKVHLLCPKSPHRAA